ncbi:hypothetical protein A9Q94_19970 [Rhodobacterales bacterium 56_14_T64]|nr:hypothetical protein A9Q94_19970 [Rhodobacterales bacterium 56_14_T64]
MTLQPRPPSVGADVGFRLESIETQVQMLALKSAWQDLEARDPEGTVYLSWDWLAATFAGYPGRWRVLIAWQGDQMVCAFPMKLRLHWSNSRQQLQTEIEAGGRLIYSEYTGFLCDPVYQNTALSEIAQHLQNLPWVRLSLKYEDSTARAAAFMAAFPEAQFRSRNKDYFINAGSTDNLACPRVTLPQSYEAYLDGLGKNMRQKMRRFSRKYLDSGALRLSWADAEDAGAGIEHLLRHWLVKWLPSKGEAKARKSVNTYRKMLTQAANLGLLRMPVLWQQDRCLGVLGHVLDPRHRQIHFIVAGRDEAVTGNFIGPLLHAQSVRWGIENGYTSYDLCHGDEPYKFGYGAIATRVNYVSIRRRYLTSPSAYLDPICAPRAMTCVIDFLQQEQPAKALIVAKQLQQVLANTAGPQ